MTDFIQLEQVVCNKVSEGNHPFDNLPPDRYCLTANVNEADGHLGFAEVAQECIVIHPDDGNVTSQPASEFIIC